MDALVQNLLTAYRQSIDRLDWMGPETKKEAQAKLAKFTPKIGYPTTWRDYGALMIKRDDLVGNVMRARRSSISAIWRSSGKPIDRGEWGMTPQTINAYYNPELNEIVFPAAHPAAAVLRCERRRRGQLRRDRRGDRPRDQPRLRRPGQPVRRPTATCATGGPTRTIDEFAAKTKALVAQYDAYEPVPGYHVNGALTLGENIADNSGLAIAYKAYQLSLGGKPAPVIDGLTGDQRFFLGFAQVWRSKTRDATLVARIKTDPHSPGEFRANGTLSNQPGFYDAFDVKPGDKMYTRAGKARHRSGDALTRSPLFAFHGRRRHAANAAADGVTGYLRRRRAATSAARPRPSNPNVSGSGTPVGGGAAPAGRSTIAEMRLSASLEPALRVMCNEFRPTVRKLEMSYEAMSNRFPLLPVPVPVPPASEAPWKRPPV